MPVIRIIKKLFFSAYVIFAIVVLLSLNVEWGNMPAFIRQELAATIVFFSAAIIIAVVGKIALGLTVKAARKISGVLGRAAARLGVKKASEKLLATTKKVVEKGLFLVLWALILLSWAVGEAGDSSRDIAQSLNNEDIRYSAGFQRFLANYTGNTDIAYDAYRDYAGSNVEGAWSVNVMIIGGAGSVVLFNGLLKLYKLPSKFALKTLGGGLLRTSLGKGLIGVATFMDIVSRLTATDKELVRLAGHKKPNLLTKLFAEGILSGVVFGVMAAFLGVIVAGIGKAFNLLRGKAKAQN